MQAQPSTQAINYDRIFVDGYPHQIHPRTITLRAMFITREPQLGSLKEAYIVNGNQHLRFSGSMENVRLRRPTSYPALPDGIFYVAGSGKSILWFVDPLLYLSKLTDVVYHFTSSTIIEDIQVMCDTDQASMAYFYFDFRDISKQHWRDLVPSLLTQLSARSGPRCDILSRSYSDHDNGAKQPSNDTLTRCLKEMLALPDQRPIYLIMDALDECSNLSEIPSSRNRVLRLVKELVDMHAPNLHICVTSRPEVDIRDVLEPLTSLQVSLHDQSGQQKDIEDYVRSVVYSDSEPIMRRWRKEDKELVVETLSNLADGM